MEVEMNDERRPSQPPPNTSAVQVHPGLADHDFSAQWQYAFIHPDKERDELPDIDRSEFQTRNTAIMSLLHESHCWYEHV